MTSTLSFAHDIKHTRIAFPFHQKINNTLLLIFLAFGTNGIVDPELIGDTRSLPSRPAPNTPELFLPLTVFDVIWLKFNPVEHIFFYQLTDPSPGFFHSVIVPKLKRSLSLTLTHFPLLAGRLTWPAHEPKPAIVFKPNQDSVSLTVAESKDPESFAHLVGNKPHKATESRPYVPELHGTDSEAAVISLQLTLFPNHGFAVGISVHHAIFDGKCTSLFFKAWARINKQMLQDSSSEEPSLPPELTPFLDRSVVQDPDGLYLEYLDWWGKVNIPGSDNNPRSLSLSPVNNLDPTLVRATFDVSGEDVRKLRELVLSKLGVNGKTLHLSTFVLIYSYALTCLVKAKNMDGSSKVRYLFAADSRARLNPPIPENYLGNCVCSFSAVLEADAIKGEDGFAVVAKSVGETIKELSKRSVLEIAKVGLINRRDTVSERVTVSGSPQFEFYKVDFGWGRPLKMDITSIDRTGAISIADRRDGSDGVQTGLVLTKQEMEVFDSLFAGGLIHLSRGRSRL